MNNSPINASIDIHERFRAELREINLNQADKGIVLEGNAMLRDAAKILLRIHAPRITFEENKNASIGIDKEIIHVQLMSMERFGSMFLASFLKERAPPDSPTLLSTVPEMTIIEFAKKNDIPVEYEIKDDVRQMLDAIAQRQPQTYFSLCRSAKRLQTAAEILRTETHKHTE